MSSASPFDLEPQLLYQQAVRLKTTLGFWKQRYIRVLNHGLASYHSEFAELQLDFLSAHVIRSVAIDRGSEVRVIIKSGVEGFNLCRLKTASPEVASCLHAALTRCLSRDLSGLDARDHPLTTILPLSTSSSASSKTDTTDEPLVSRWQWQDNDGLWRNFNETASRELRLLEKRKATEGLFTLTSKTSMNSHQVNFTEKKMVNVAQGRLYDVRPSKEVLKTSTASSSSSSSSKTYRKSPSLATLADPRADPSATLNQVSKITAFCNKLSESFIDPDFPPTGLSLYMNGTQAQGVWECGACTSKNEGTLVCHVCETTKVQVSDWLRPQQATLSSKTVNLTSPWVVFDATTGPSPADIQQGALGNCWFLSALSVLAEKPELLKRLYVTTAFNPAGVYLIRLCKNGVWQQIIIDDFFPCAMAGRLAYSQANRKQLWVPLIEKAIAKCFGSYEAIASGQIYDGMSILTGRPVVKIDLRPIKSRPANRQLMRVESTSAMGMMGYEDETSEGDILWLRLLSFREAGYLMGASCGIYDDEEAQVDLHISVGLQKFHAYSILDVRIVMLSTSTTPARLIQLRNPWGVGEKGRWTGSWSDSSDMWTPDLRHTLCPEGPKPGVFWMSFDDCRRYFGRVDVCKIRSDWFESRHTGMFPSQIDRSRHFALKVTCKESVQLEVTLQQPSDRGFMEGTAIPYVDMALCILKSCPITGKLELVTDTRRNPIVFVNLESFLEAGQTYLILPMGFNKLVDTVSVQYTVVIHSSKRVKIEPVPLIDDNLMIRALSLRAHMHGERKEIFDKQFIYTQSHDAGAVILVENHHPTLHLQVEMNNSDSFNVCSSRNSMITKDTIPPNSFQLIQVLSQITDSGYSWSSKLRYNGNRRFETHSPPVKAPGLHCPQRFKL